MEEWAVLEEAFRGPVALKDGLGSREEAEAWMVALSISQKRQDYERFMKTDGLMARGSLFVASREIGSWH